MLYALPETTRIQKYGKVECRLKTLLLSGARGETVFGQFVFSPKKTAHVSSVLSKSFINRNNTLWIEPEIFWLASVRLLKQSCSYGGTGDFPEVMVPLSAMLNKQTEWANPKVEADSNQVFVVSFTIPTDTHAGKYTGAITLQTDLGEFCIETLLTVLDFALPKQNHSLSAFAVWYLNERVLLNRSDELPKGEKYQDYLKMFDLLKKYRIAATELPVKSAADCAYCSACDGNLRAFEPRRGILAADLDNFVDAAKQYAADEGVPCYSLPYDTLIVDGEPRVDKESLFRLLSALVNHSTAALDLLKKSYLYITFIDEPGDEMLPLVRKTTEDVRAVLLLVASACDFTNKENVKTSLLQIDNVVPSWPVEKIYGGVDTWCPTFSGWHAPEFVRRMRDMIALGSKNWWYGCISPWYPFPSYHIDEPLLGARIEGILRYLFDIKGNLYWAVNFDKHYDDQQKRLIEDDIYGGKMFWDQSNGEGLLVFDGNRFGIDQPLPSLRLAAICQGNQDYEYCWMLDNEVRRLCVDYDIQKEAKDCLKPLIQKLFDRTAIVDETQFLPLRQELAEAYMAAKNGVLMFVSAVDAATQTAEVTLYSPIKAVVQSVSKRTESRLAGLGKADVFAVELGAADTYFEVQIQTPEKNFVWKRFVSSPVCDLPVSRLIPQGELSFKRRGAETVFKTESFDNSASPKLEWHGQYDLSRLENFCFKTQSYTNDAFFLSVILTDNTDKSFYVGYDLIEKGDNVSCVHFNPVMQLNGWREIRRTTAYSHYLPESDAQNKLDLKHITKITLEVQNEREFCSLNPRQLRYVPYTFVLKSFSFSQWTDRDPYAYAQQKMQEERGRNV